MAKFTVIAQISSGDPCPKYEEDAWDYKREECDTLADCISFLLLEDALGFRIFDADNNVVAEDTAVHCGPRGGSDED